MRILTYMSSFLGTLKSVGKLALGIASNPLVESGISLWNPAVGALWKRVAGAIVTIEAQHEAQGLEKSGPSKLAFVAGDFEEGLAVTKEILALSGKKLEYDVDLMHQAVSAQVQVFNTFAALKNTFKISDV